MISPPKKINKEFRVIVGNGEIIDYSQYMEENEVNICHKIDEGALKLSLEISKLEWQPDSVYICDISLSDGEYKLIEINAFSTSGLYEYNLKKVIREVSIIALNDFNNVFGE
jgi:hypothetical protein